MTDICIVFDCTASKLKYKISDDTILAKENKKYSEKLTIRLHT